MSTYTSPIPLIPTSYPSPTSKDWAPDCPPCCSRSSRSHARASAKVASIRPWQTACHCSNRRGRSRRRRSRRSAPAARSAAGSDLVVARSTDRARRSLAVHQRETGVARPRARRAREAEACRSWGCRATEARRRNAVRVWGGSLQASAPPRTRSSRRYLLSAAVLRVAR